MLSAYLFNLLHVFVFRGTNTSAADFAMNRYMDRGVNDRIDPNHLAVEGTQTACPESGIILI